MLSNDVDMIENFTAVLIRSAKVCLHTKAVHRSCTSSRAEPESRSEDFRWVRPVLDRARQAKSVQIIGAVSEPKKAQDGSFFDSLAGWLQTLLSKLIGCNVDGFGSRVQPRNPFRVVVEKRIVFER